MDKRKLFKKDSRKGELKKEIGQMKFYEYLSPIHEQTAQRAAHPGIYLMYFEKGKNGEIPFGRIHESICTSKDKLIRHLEGSRKHISDLAEKQKTYLTAHPFDDEITIRIHRKNLEKWQESIHVFDEVIREMKAH